MRIGTRERKRGSFMCVACQWTIFFFYQKVEKYLYALNFIACPLLSPSPNLKQHQHSHSWRTLKTCFQLSPVALCNVSQYLLCDLSICKDQCRAVNYPPHPPPPTPSTNAVSSHKPLTCHFVVLLGSLWFPPLKDFLQTTFSNMLLDRFWLCIRKKKRERWQ